MKNLHFSLCNPCFFSKQSCDASNGRSVFAFVSLRWGDSKIRWSPLHDDSFVKWWRKMKFSRESDVVMYLGAKSEVFLSGNW